jgi:hypothetical protein
MQYKVSLIDPTWNLANAPPIKLWKTNLDGPPKLPMGVLSPVPSRPVWGIDPSRFVERQKFMHAKLSKYVNFWKVSTAQNATYEMKMKLYVEIGRISYYICQEVYPIKMPLFWRGFGHQTFGDPTTLGFHCRPLLLVLI